MKDDTRTTTADSAKTRDVHFGVDDHLQALIDRIDRHFEFGDNGDAYCGDNDAFVVGLFAPWGCGKSHWLKYIEHAFNENLTYDEVPTAVTLPIFFNAWQFEKEPHLIVPLLKTAQARLVTYQQAWQEEIKSFEADLEAAGLKKKRVLPWIKDRVGLLKDTALALAAGLSGEISTPYGKLKISLKDMLAEDGRRTAAREAVKNAASESDPLERYESIYYNLYNYLAELTGRSVKAPTAPDDEATLPNIRLNLLFLIDDVDRCLPDKAVEMLEAIKLFLEVEGCAFVVAVDDEVVNRGILYRYRDYIKKNGEDNGAPDTPITGAEYLEKIIHLPVRVPPISEKGAEAFLLKRYPALFEVKSAKAGKEEREVAELGAMPLREPKGSRQNDAAEKQALLELFVRAVPLVPRKLIRAVELFMMLNEVAEKSNFPDYQPLLLARLTLLQLFAPDVYRLGRFRARRAYAQYLVEWRDKSIETLKDQYCDNRNGNNANDNGQSNDGDVEANRIKRERLILPLFEALDATLKRRSGFDPRNAFNGIDKEESVSVLAPDIIRQYYELVEASDGRASKAANDKLGALDGQGRLDDLSAEMGRAVREPLSLPEGRPEDMAAFLALAFSTDSKDWRNALSTERDRLGGKVFDKETFSELRNKANKRPNIISVDWLETFEPHLTAEQMTTLYDVTDLFGRLERNHG